MSCYFYWKMSNEKFLGKFLGEGKQIWVLLGKIIFLGKPKQTRMLSQEIWGYKLSLASLG